VSSNHVFLLRHAKSSWSDPALEDHDRPLAPRGVDAVQRMRRHFANAGISPQLVLCSSAARTVATLEGIRAALSPLTLVKVEPGLYAASQPQLLRRLRLVDDDVTSVLVIGHNPGLEDLAAELVGSGDDTARQRMDAKFPTGALAALSFDVAWADLAPGVARLESFVVPRDLA
jgi:phosphohistidine phosphatase